MNRSNDRNAHGSSPNEVVDSDGLHHVYGDNPCPQVVDGNVEVITVGGKTERIYQDIKKRE